ncbi:hypothetical protein JCM10207_006520 [Rhodosporidiobolus poonsookiae]
MSRTKHAVYEAHDEDDPTQHDWQQGEEGEEEGDYGWGDDYDGADGDDDDYGEGVTIIRAPPKPAAPQTDLAVESYLDPLALVNAWEGALLDLKDMHPERFLPPTEAPRSLAQKQARAPIWYGPPPSAASTSKLPPPPASAPQPLSAHTIPSAFSTTSISNDSHAAQEQPKKRKRLTGSQKKARKQAKLAAASVAGGAVSIAGEQAYEEDEGDTGAYDEGPAFQPDSPPHFPAPALPVAGPSQPPPLSSAPKAASPIPSSSAAPAHPSLARPPHPSSFSFLVPPIGRLPHSIPPPPPITPLSGGEPSLEPESADQLLEAMLWSYYTAGYQTALYHAAVGVAKFKHEAPTNGADQ